MGRVGGKAMTSYEEMELRALRAEKERDAMAGWLRLAQQQAKESHNSEMSAMLLASMLGAIVMKDIQIGIPPYEHAIVPQVEVDAAISAKIKLAQDKYTAALLADTLPGCRCRDCKWQSLIAIDTDSFMGESKGPSMKTHYGCRHPRMSLPASMVGPQMPDFGCTLGERK